MFRTLVTLSLLTLAFSGCDSSEIEPTDTAAPTEIDYRANGEPSVEGPDAAPGANSY